MSHFQEIPKTELSSAGASLAVAGQNEDPKGLGSAGYKPLMRSLRGSPHTEALAERETARDIFQTDPHSIAKEIGFEFRGEQDWFGVGRLWEFTCTGGELSGVTFYVRAGASAEEILSRWIDKQAEFGRVAA